MTNIAAVSSAAHRYSEYQMSTVFENKTEACAVVMVETAVFSTTSCCFVDQTECTDKTIGLASSSAWHSIHKDN